MNARKLQIAALALVSILMFGSGTALAQGSVAPSGQFGIGVTTGGAFTLQYAVTPSIIVGMGIGLENISQGGASATYYDIEPGVRFLLEGVVNPFLFAGLNLEKSRESGGVATTAIGAGFGLEYFISRNVGVWASAPLLVLQLDPSPTATAFGFGVGGGGAAGVEWYFNR